MLEAFCTSWLFHNIHVDFFLLYRLQRKNNILQNNVALKFIRFYCLFWIFLRS